MRDSLSDVNIDKVAVITGAARGLGKSFSEALLKRGYKVRLYYVEIVYNRQVTMIVNKVWIY